MNGDKYTLSEEQKVFYDTEGYLHLPAVVSEQELQVTNRKLILKLNLSP